MNFLKSNLQIIYHHLYLKKREEIPFIIFSTFLWGFLATRIFVFIFWNEILDGLALNIRGTHVHHFNYGILMIVIVAFVALTNRAFTDRHVRKLAAIFGLGLAVMLDEFAMWMQLDENNYWSKTNYNAIITTILVMINIVYFRGFWQVMGKKTFFRPIKYFWTKWLNLKKSNLFLHKK